MTDHAVEQYLTTHHDRHLAELNEFHGRMAAPGGGGGCGCDMGARRGSDGNFAGGLMLLGLGGLVLGRRRGRAGHRGWSEGGLA